MTETNEKEEAINLIDEKLTLYANRELVSAEELSDILLDLRGIFSESYSTKESMVN